MDKKKSTNQTPTPNSKWLVFTSAGDSNNIKNWLKSRKFDLWICYYGDKKNSLSKNSDFYFERKGGKTQNFYYALSKWRTQIKKYDAVLLADDDIIISGKNINRLFNIRDEYNLKALQPAFNIRGKNSHKFTEAKPFTKLRYTNFIEIGFPLFEQQALLEFMELYKPAVNCWGVDWWFSYVIKEKYGKKSIAIIDEIMALNPFDNDKKNGSEIEKLSSIKKLSSDWDLFQHDNAITTEKGIYKVYSKVPTFNIILFLIFLSVVFSYNIERIKNKIKFILTKQ